jgi:hypothetical protein
MSRGRMGARAALPALLAAAAVLFALPSSGAAAETHHYEYLFNDGPVHVYDIDHEFKEVESFELAATKKGVRGVMAPADNPRIIYVSYGGDGGGNGSGDVLAYDLVAKKVLWEKSYPFGIDSGAITNDGTKIFMPTGENAANDEWHVLNPQKEGEVVETIKACGEGPHDGVLSADGKILQLGDRNCSHLSIYNVETGKLQEQVGPMVGGVRPNTINGNDSVSFTTATGFDGFQIGSITKPGGPILYTENFGSSTCEFSTCSHGISLSPDSKEVAVVDAVKKVIQFWNVAGVENGVAPTHVADVPVNGLTGNEIGCAYDCGRSGWLQHTRDGRYVLAGDNENVIAAATHTTAYKIPALLNTKKFMEIDWNGTTPSFTTNRQGIGYSEAPKEEEPEFANLKSTGNSETGVSLSWEVKNQAFLSSIGLSTWCWGVGNGSDCHFVTLPPSATSYTFSGLEPEREYLFLLSGTWKSGSTSLKTFDYLQAGTAAKPALVATRPSRSSRRR